jgi:hypothetical protein
MKQSDFSDFEKVILNKSLACDTEIKYMLNRCLSMFHYENLPATIPQSNLELLLQTKGSCFLTKHNGNFYALEGNEGGEYDVYNNPTKFIVSNSALNISKDFNIGNEGVLIKNDFFSLGILPIVKKYCVMLKKNHISIRQAIINARAISIISANDDKTKASADIFLKKMVEGELSVIGETPFFEGIKSYDISKSLALRELIEIEQYLKAAMYHELGIDANLNLKRSVISSFEVELNDDFLLPLVDNFYNCRLTAIQQFNKMYNLDVKISFASSWLTNQLENLKEQKILMNTEIENKTNEINSKNNELTANNNKILELEKTIEELQKENEKLKDNIKNLTPNAFWLKN